MGFFDKLKQLMHYDEVISAKSKEVQQLDEQINNKLSEITNIKQDIETAMQQKTEAETQRDAELKKTRKSCEEIIQTYHTQTTEAKENYEHAQKNYEEINSEFENSKKELDFIKEKVKLLKSFIRKSLKNIEDDKEVETTSSIDELCPTVELALNSFDVKDLKALIKENQKTTNALLSKYESRYTTKTNKAIYQLMVLALRAELQNILVDLKYSNVEKCKNNLNEMINKFLVIASDGNQAIAPTIKSFITEISILFNQAIDIEYTYFVRKEQEKAEQQAIKEQMRQEAEERKALEQEQKKVEKEESKYKSEIENTEELLAACEDDEKTKQLLARIEELKGLLEKVEEKKEEIVNRQNGKAGYVYVISNLGSFGDKRFKVGMTRRLEPMERIKELGDASVPFSFDVHSFIFSEDAVGLETELHHRLDKRRTNKINLRKEFFDITIDELESLVNEICPSAEFKRTMLAIEYRKGLEIAN